MLQPTRSWLFTPGTRPDRLLKAASVGADMLTVDLEDAVAPAEKPQACRAAIDFLAATPPRSSLVRALCTNGLDTQDGVADLAALFASKVAPDYIVLPKTNGPDQVRVLDPLLAHTCPETHLIGMIESARGLAAVEAIATAAARLQGLMLASADMAADLGAEPTWQAMTYVRGRLVAACALAGITVIDTQIFDVGDGQGLADEVRQAVAMGFKAKAAIHPGRSTPSTTPSRPRRPPSPKRVRSWRRTPKASAW